MLRRNISKREENVVGGAWEMGGGGGREGESALLEDWERKTTGRSKREGNGGREE